MVIDRLLQQVFPFSARTLVDSGMESGLVLGLETEFGACSQGDVEVADYLKDKTQELPRKFLNPIEPGICRVPTARITEVRRRENSLVC